MKVIRHDYKCNQLAGPTAQEAGTYFEKSVATFFLPEDWDAVPNNASYIV